MIRVKPAVRAASRDDDIEAEREGQVQFHRVAVGKHLILGGDNLDLALAKFAENKLSPQAQLPPRIGTGLIPACRGAKETMLGENRPAEYSISLAGEGSRLIGGARTVTVSASDIDQVLVDGFFPSVANDASPEEGESGFREFGLPYPHDPVLPST